MPSPAVTGLDHVVLTVRSIDAACAFYARVLGLEIEVLQGADGRRRHALRVADQKINLHEKGAEFSPRAHAPTPGAGDLCLITETAIEAWLEHLVAKGVEILEGPVPRAGARGPMTSLYLRDPDRNLIEIARYLDAPA